MSLIEVLVQTVSSGSCGISLLGLHGARRSAAWLGFSHTQAWVLESCSSEVSGPPRREGVGAALRAARPRHAMIAARLPCGSPLHGPYTSSASAAIALL